MERSEGGKVQGSVEEWKGRGKDATERGEYRGSEMERRGAEESGDKGKEKRGTKGCHTSVLGFLLMSYSVKFSSINGSSHLL